MEFVRTIMPFTPDTWDKSCTYFDRRYVLIDIEEDSQEYEDVVKQFREKENRLVSLDAIQRVQHPFAFARYKLHQEALIINGKTFTEQVIYKSVREDNIPEYLDYNCDERRLNKSFDFDSFFASLMVEPNPTASGSVGSKSCFVQQRRIRDYFFGDRDSNTYPEYIIKLK